MKTFKTIDNRLYVATVTAEATVTDKSTGLVLAKATEAGQITFLAIGEKTDISDDRAVVVPASFSGASAGSAAGGGGGVDAVQVARMIADSDGVVHVLYEAVTQSPPEGNLDNYNAYGWAMVVTQSGRLDTVVLQPRSQGTVLDTFPVYLNIFALEGNAWKLLGCSENGVEQSLDTPSVWSFSGVELVAGQKLHIEGSRQKGSEARDARLAARVVANNLADTGIIERNGDVRVTDWVPQYTLSLSRPAGLEARGVELAEEARLEAHTMDEVRHITAAERAAWNGKADTSALAGKVNTATFNAHAGDAVKHVTAEERGSWNAAAELFKEGDTAIRIQRSIEIYDYSPGNDIGVWLRGDGVQWFTATDPGGGIPWDVLIAHPGNAEKHVTAAERAAWNAGPERLDALKVVDQEARSLFTEVVSSSSRSLMLTLHGNDGAIPAFVLDHPNHGSAIFGTDHLQIQRQTGVFKIDMDGIASTGVTCSMSFGGISCDVATLLSHPSDAVAHLATDERAELAELLAHKDELLALLQQPTQ